MEHRWGQRIVVDMPVQMTASDAPRSRSAQLINLSMTGAFLKGEFMPRRLSRVQIFFGAVRDAQGEAMGIAAYVTRNHRYGIGVEWSELGSSAVIDMLRAAGKGQDSRHVPMSGLRSNSTEPSRITR